jgi:hypothetical protein
MAKETLLVQTVNRAKHELPGAADTNVVSDMLIRNNMAWPDWAASFQVTVTRDLGIVYLALAVSPPNKPIRTIYVAVRGQYSAALLDQKLFALYKTLERQAYYESIK